MLYTFGFERVGVVISDLFFVDPNPREGQEGAERGVRLELRLLEHGELRGSIYSARPIEIGKPIWRADLLELASGPPGSLNRAHHHPAFNGWEPGRRTFDPELVADPVGWVGQQLADLQAVLERADVSDGDGDGDEFAADAKSLQDHAPEIMGVLRQLLDDVKAGKAAIGPDGDTPDSARNSWL